MLHSRFSLHTYFTCGGGGDLVAKSCPTLCNPTDGVAHQASLSMGFPRQDYWNGLPFPSLGDLPNPGIELLHWQADSLPLSPQGSPFYTQ